jgi:hypothetical protein
VDERHVDGNVLGGVLGDVFVADLTMATTTCAACGTVASVAVLRVYLDAPGAVGRCAGCGAVQVRLVNGRDRSWLDMSGVRVLEIPRMPEAEAT